MGWCSTEDITLKCRFLVCPVGGSVDKAETYCSVSSSCKDIRGFVVPPLLTCQRCSTNCHIDHLRFPSYYFIVIAVNWNSEVLLLKVEDKLFLVQCSQSRDLQTTDRQPTWQQSASLVSFSSVSSVSSVSSTASCSCCRPVLGSRPLLQSSIPTRGGR